MLVDFGDEGTAVVCFCRIVEGSVSDGRCRVNWDDGEEYDGDLIITDKRYIKLIELLCVQYRINQ